MLTFPALMGQGWSVHKRPTWTTLVAEHVSGREVRDQLWQNPRWEFELLFDGLDGTPSGQYEALGAQSLQQLLGLRVFLGGNQPGCDIKGRFTYRKFMSWNKSGLC